MTLRPITRVQVLCAVAALAFVSSVQADTRSDSVSYGVDAGMGEVDNVTLVPTGKVSQTIATADADFAVKQQSRLFDDSVKGQFSYFDYLETAFSSQLIGRLDGTADLALVPERILWSLQDDFGQASLSPFAAQTPANLENINSLSTGPQLNLRLGGANFLTAKARYTRVQYQTSPFNSNRYLGSLELGFPLSARSTVAFNVNSERVLFENTVVNSDFDRSSAYGSYEIHGARTDLTAKLGVTRVIQDGTVSSGPLAKLDLTRQVSPASQATLSAGRDITDASASFANLQGGAISGITTAQAAVTSSVYTLTYAQLSWRYNRNRTTFGLSARWEKDSYENAPLVNVVGIGQPVANYSTDAAALDNTRRGAEFTFEHKITRALGAQLLGSYYDTDYANGNFAADQGSSRYADSRIGAGLNFHAGRGLDIRLRYDHIARVISGAGSGTGYRENSVFLTIGYRPRSPSEAPASP